MVFFRLSNLMLDVDQRKKKLTFKPEHLGPRLKERSHLFPFGCKLSEMWTEIENAIKNPKKGVIIEDERDGKHSTHICVFVSDAGKIVATPIAVNESTIHVFTVKDVAADESNPNWFIRGYNAVAEKRGLEKLPLIIKNTT